MKYNNLCLMYSKLAILINYHAEFQEQSRQSMNLTHYTKFISNWERCAFQRIAAGLLLENTHTVCRDKSTARLALIRKLYNRAS